MPVPHPARAAIAASLLLATATPALADAQPRTDRVTLSEADREAALEAGATRALDEPPINGLDRRVHGEIGMEIGTGGYRSLYGTAAVPLGENGMAQFSFMTGQMGRWRR
jgi:hypothetical protein